MSGVALLPEEFRCAQERTGAHLPSHDIAPLIAEQWQVAVGVDPVFVGVPYHCLRRRTDDELLVEFSLRVDDDVLAVVAGLQTVMSDNGTLLGESLYVLGLTGKEALRDEQREISILDTQTLEVGIENRLHLLPYRIAIRLNNHTSAHRSCLRQVGFHHQVVVPLRVVLSSLSKLF